MMMMMMMMLLLLEAGNVCHRICNVLLQTRPQAMLLLL